MKSGLFAMKVPASWSSRPLGELVEEGSDSGIPSEVPTLPYIGMEHVESVTGRVIALASPNDYKSSSYIAKSNQVLYGRLRPYLNKVFIPDREVYVSREFIPLTPGESLNSKFLLYLLRSSEFVNHAMSLNSGDRPRVKWQQIESCLISTPPLAEQEEIVRILEEQFSRLDAAAASIAAVRRKAARLRAAFFKVALSGALNPPDEADAWELTSIGEIVEFGRKPPKDLLDTNSEVSFVPMACVEEESGRVQLDQTIGAAEGKRRSLTYFEEGDVLFAKITPCMENGKVAIAKGLRNGAAFGSSEFYVLQPLESRVRPEYLNYVLVDPNFRAVAARAMTGAVGQQRVPRKFVEDFEILVPPLRSQDEIIAMLRSQFSRIESALLASEVIQKKLLATRRSLLHAAFTGELTKEWREKNNG